MLHTYAMMMLAYVIAFMNYHVESASASASASAGASASASALENEQDRLRASDKRVSLM